MNIRDFLERKLKAFPRVVEYLSICYANLTESDIPDNSREFWQNFENILEEISEISGLKTQDIYYELKALDHFRNEFKSMLKQRSEETWFERIRKLVYEQDAYPILEHIGYGWSEHIFRRKNFIIKQVRTMTSQSLKFCDLGVGPGVIFTTILREKLNWIGYGVDISSKCVEYARKMVSLNGINNRAYIEKADIRSTPYQSSMFDMVIASEVLEHVPDPKEGLMELVRILKPGGYAIIALPICFEQPEHLYIFADENECKNAYKELGLCVEHFEKWEYLAGLADVADSFTVCRKELK